MLNCKDASELASQSLDKTLPLSRRWALRMHVFMCHRCRRYLQQLRIVKRASTLLAQRLEQDSNNTFLPVEAKTRIQTTLDERNRNAP